MQTRTILTALVGRFKMTQKEIADSVGVSQPTISALLNGKRKRTSFETGSAIESLYESKLKTVERRARGPRPQRQPLGRS